MTSLTMSWGHVEGLRRFEHALKVLGSTKFAVVVNPAVNRTGDMSRTQVRRNLSKQTGLTRKTIVAAVRVTRSSPATLTYRIEAHGGDVALKFFKARETRKGVSAAPFGHRRVFEHTFMMGGRFPGRKPLNMGGHVFARVSGDRFPIEKRKSGVVIPTEMVKGETKRAFEETVGSVLPRRVEHEIKRATKGAVT